MILEAFCYGFFGTAGFWLATFPVVLLMRFGETPAAKAAEKSLEALLERNRLSEQQHTVLWRIVEALERTNP